MSESLSGNQPAPQQKRKAAQSKQSHAGRFGNGGHDGVTRITGQVKTDRANYSVSFNDASDDPIVYLGGIIARQNQPAQSGDINEPCGISVQAAGKNGAGRRAGIKTVVGRHRSVAINTQVAAKLNPVGGNLRIVVHVYRHIRSAREPPGVTNTKGIQRIIYSIAVQINGGCGPPDGSNRETREAGGHVTVNIERFSPFRTEN